MYEMKEKAAMDMVDYADPLQYCRAFIKEDSMVELIDNNLCEALNKELLPAREMPIISLFEHIRRYIMQRQVRKRKQATRWKNGIGKKVWAVLNKGADISQWCSVSHNGEGGYEIDHGDRTYVVKLDDKTCTCRRYTLSGIPCAHAICVIRDRRHNPVDYVSS